MPAALCGKLQFPVLLAVPSPRKRTDISLPNFHMNCVPKPHPHKPKQLMVHTHTKSNVALGRPSSLLSLFVPKTAYFGELPSGLPAVDNESARPPLCPTEELLECLEPLLFVSSKRLERKSTPVRQRRAAPAAPRSAKHPHPNPHRNILPPRPPLHNPQPTKAHSITHLS